MTMPFPGMDPYLENPILWTGVHSRLINAISSQLAPALRPRYVVSIEERVVIDVPAAQRVPDLWIQKSSSTAAPTIASPNIGLAEPIIMYLADDPIHEPYIEILDRYQDLRVVTVLELLSPINKAAGPGREQFLQKRRATLNSSTHLIEIDLLRRGMRSYDLTAAQLSTLGDFDYLIATNRFHGNPGDARNRFELIPCHLRQRLPKFGIPLVPPDADAVLDLKAALDRVYEEGSYMLRIKYDGECIPSLTSEDQQWVYDNWNAYRAVHPEWFQ